MPKGYWTLENIMPFANQCKSRSEFQKRFTAAYKGAKKRSDFEEICKHMISLHEVWSFEKLKSLAQKCKTKKEFKALYPKAHGAAILRSDYDEIVFHMPKRVKLLGRNNPKHRWTYEKLKEMALQCKTFMEFATRFPSAYLTSSRRDDFNEICANLERQISKPYTEEDLIIKSKSCSTRSEMSIKYPSEYNAIKRFDDRESFFEHMKGSATSSNAEIDLFDIVRSVYPKAQKLIDKRVKIANKKHIVGFHIDIYVPELKMGIEFDGTYWHSEAGLKRSRQDWPQEDIYNYHRIKDDYFALKGISILHIKEEDWIKDKEKCIKKCFEFLAEGKTNE